MPSNSSQCIPPEVAQSLASASFDQDGVGKIVALLPDDDAALHGWLVAKAEELNEREFSLLCAAAEMAGRVLPASLLPRMLALGVDYWILAKLAWRMEADVTEQLLEGLEMNRTSGQLRSMALFVAAAWWMEHRKEAPLPPQIVHSAIELMKFDLDEVTIYRLSALATHIGQENAKEMATAGKRHRHFKVPYPESVQDTLRGFKRPFEKMLPEREPRGSGGSTQRRASEKVGRNEPCRCGSGKKYKNCCEKEDLKRRSDSSPIPGVTRSELEADPHLGLDRQRLKAMTRTQLLTLEPARITDDLEIAYLLALGDHKCCDRIVEAYETWGGPAKMGNVWSHMLQYLMWSWRPDLARRMVKVAPAEGAGYFLAAPDVRLLLVGDDPALFLKEMEALAKEVLESGSLEGLQELVWAVNSSPYRALSILLLRGLLPICEDEDIQQNYDAILRVRAKLGLGPDDAFSQWMNDEALRKAREHENEPMQEAQDKLARIAKQARQATEDNARLERELRLLKKQSRVQEPETQTSHHPDEETQRKIRTLNADKKHAQALAREKGEAELAARKELEKLTRENEELKAAANGGRAAEGEDEEEAGDFVVTGKQPVRLLAFPKDFRLTLANYKSHVARAAMNRLGRMAAGEAAAFDKLKAIVALPGVLEARISDRYRLFFSLLPTCVRVVDLIYRPEMEAKIEHYKVAGLPPAPEFE